MHNNLFDELLTELQTDYPTLQFIRGKAFCWLPVTRQIMYKPQIRTMQSGETTTVMYSLLHEVGHALLGHERYKLDFELLELEVAAWERAKGIAGNYTIVIEESHIQDCLDSYRDWLYRRSICPTCTTKALQLDNEPAYRCFNCHATWRVAPSRFCRPYRKIKGELQLPAAVFSDHALYGL